MVEIIKFYGDWCQPCKQLDKILEGQEYTKIDVEDNIELSAKMGIKQLPTMLFKKVSTQSLILKAFLISCA